MKHKFFKAYVAHWYPDTMAYTDSTSNYRGRYVNPSVFSVARREKLLSMKDSISVSVLGPIAHTLTSVEYHRGMRISWSVLARRIFIWGCNGGLTPEDIFKGETDAQKIKVIKDRFDTSIFVKDGENLKKLGSYPRANQTTIFKLLTSVMTEDFLNDTRNGLSKLLSIPNDREYSRTYVINMILAHFLDRGMPIHETF